MIECSRAPTGSQGQTPDVERQQSNAEARLPEIPSTLGNGDAISEDADTLRLGKPASIGAALIAGVGDSGDEVEFGVPLRCAS